MNISKIESLKLELTDLEQKNSAVKELNKKYAHELERLESGDGDLTKVVSVTVSLQATETTLGRYERQKSELEYRLSQLEAEQKKQEDIQQLKDHAKLSESLYNATIVARRELGELIERSCKEIALQESEFHQLKLETQGIIGKLGFKSDSDLAPLEKFLEVEGITQTAFRFLTNPNYQYWFQVHERPLKRPIAFNHQIAQVIASIQEDRNHE